ncbi:putative mutator protein MutT4 [compost metagenome]
MELGETPEATAKREIYEETGIQVSDLKLIGVFSGERLFTTLSNGDQYYNVIVCYTSKESSGQFTNNDSEILDVRFFSLEDMPENTSNISQCILLSSGFFSEVNDFQANHPKKSLRKETYDEDR